MLLFRLIVVVVTDKKVKKKNVFNEISSVNNFKSFSVQPGFKKSETLSIRHFQTLFNSPFLSKITIFSNIFDIPNFLLTTQTRDSKTHLTEELRQKYFVIEELFKRKQRFYSLLLI